MSRKLIMSIVLLLASPAVFAHTGDHSGSGIGAGLVHALTGIDHMIAMLAIGLWSAYMSAAKRQQLVTGLPLVLAAGFVLGAVTGLGSMIATADIAIALSLVLLGGLIAVRKLGLGEIPALLMAAVFVMIHGVAHTEALSGNAVGFVVGLMVTSTLLVAFGATLGQWLKREASIAMSGLGVLVSLSGLVLVPA